MDKVARLGHFENLVSWDEKGDYRLKQGFKDIEDCLDTYPPSECSVQAFSCKDDYRISHNTSAALYCDFGVWARVPEGLRGVQRTGDCVRANCLAPQVADSRVSVRVRVRIAWLWK